ncbi:hypothetical protein CGLO_13422 [Colletotrichum gloeosporioides Cg-14]|uniref:ATPase AAA-type core domain-containing protein n=1 Tax=Colletotrichum gloeosporioides (strain Cg-14) TaxID=1237896 RepID=T0JWQ1_COLGC|nr:hypothetical protein CGLO_13422 [Colletotrichum gloeosporioides Cg-14]
MEPEVLVLDEPTAGLDPRGRKEIMDMFYDLHQKANLTTILVTHSDRHAERVVCQSYRHVFVWSRPPGND